MKSIKALPDLKAISKQELEECLKTHDSLLARGNARISKELPERFYLDFENKIEKLSNVLLQETIQFEDSFVNSRKKGRKGVSIVNLVTSHSDLKNSITLALIRSSERSSGDLPLPYFLSIFLGNLVNVIEGKKLISYKDIDNRVIKYFLSQIIELLFQQDPILQFNLILNKPASKKFTHTTQYLAIR